MALDGTGQRPGNVAGARVRIGTPEGPTKRSRLVTRSVSEIIPTGGGLASLGASLSTFFASLGNTLDKASDAEHRLNMIDIQNENRKATIRGRTKAELGEGLSDEDKKNPALVEGFNQVDIPRRGATKRRASRAKGSALAFAGKSLSKEDEENPDIVMGHVRTTAENLGNEAISEWKTKVLDFPPGTDVPSVFTAWLESKVKDPNFRGGQDLLKDTFISIFMATVMRGTQESRVAEIRFQHKLRVRDQVGMFTQNIVAALNQNIALDIVKLIELGRAADPRKSDGAIRADIISAGIAWAAATGGRGRLVRIEQLAKDIGFAGQFPKKFILVQQKLQRNSSLIKTIEGLKEYEALHIKTVAFAARKGFKSQKEFGLAVGSLVRELNTLRNKHGDQSGEHNRVERTIEKGVLKFAKTETEINKVLDAVNSNGRKMLPTTLIKKNYNIIVDRFFTAKDGTETAPLSRPELFARLITSLGVNTISPEWRSRFGSALSDPDGGNYVAVMQTLTAVKKMNGDQLEAALALLPSNMHRRFGILVERRRLFKTSHAENLDWLSRNKERLDKMAVKGISFQTITGADSVQKGKIEVQDKIAELLAKNIDGLSEEGLSLTMRAKLAHIFKTEFLAGGTDDWELSAVGFVTSIVAGGRFQLVPGTEGINHLRLSSMPPPGTNLDNIPQLDFRFGPTSNRVSVPLRKNVLNRFGESEDTLNIWATDLSLWLGAILGGKNGDADEYGLSASKPGAKDRSIYAVQRNGTDITLSQGQTLIIHGKKIGLKGSNDDIREQLDKAGYFDPARSIKVEIAKFTAKERSIERFKRGERRSAFSGELISPSTQQEKGRNAFSRERIPTSTQQEKTLSGRFLLFEIDGQLFLGWRAGFLREDIPPKERKLNFERMKAKEEEARRFRGRFEEILGTEGGGS